MSLQTVYGNTSIVIHPCAFITRLFIVYQKYSVAAPKDQSESPKQAERYVFCSGDVYVYNYLVYHCTAYLQSLLLIILIQQNKCNSGWSVKLQYLFL